MLHFTLSQLIRYYKKTYKTYEINHKKDNRRFHQPCFPCEALGNTVLNKMGCKQKYRTSQ